MKDAELQLYPAELNPQTPTLPNLKGVGGWEFGGVGVWEGGSGGTGVRMKW